MDLIRRIYDISPTRQIERLVQRSETLAAEARMSVQTVEDSTIPVVVSDRAEPDGQIGGMTSSESELWHSQILSE